MDSKIISISVPLNMLRKIDQAAAEAYQTRSNFIRMAIVEKFGARSQYNLSIDNTPDLHSNKQIAAMYEDSQKEYEQYIADLKAEEAKD